MVPASIVSNFIQPSQPLNPSQPWLDQEGDNATFDRMVLRFGLRQPEQFDQVELAIEELHRVSLSTTESFCYSLTGACG